MFTLAQLSPVPEVALPAEWGFWLVGFLVFIILTLAGFIFLIFKLAQKGLGTAWDDAKKIHGEAIEELTYIRKEQVKQGKSIVLIEADLKETKYSVQTLTRKIRCKELDTMTGIE